MKLRNKLIPIMTAATVAATIAPIASCSTTALTVVNLINGYTPSIKKAVWEDYVADKKDMLAFYASAVNENPEIWAQDLYWKYTIESFYDMDRGHASIYKITPVTLEAVASDVKINKLTCFYDLAGEKKEINYYTVSFDFQFHIAYVREGGQYKLDREKVYSASVKNIPITINRDGTSVANTIKQNQQESPALGESWIVSDLEYSFLSNALPTSWIVQPILPIIESGVAGGTVYTLDYTAFDLLEKNGYEWFIKTKVETAETRTPYGQGQSQSSTDEFNYALKETEQFEKAMEYKNGDSSVFEGSLDWELAEYLSSWYLPSHYLSDIEDANEQLWKVGE